MRTAHIPVILCPVCAETLDQVFGTPRRAPRPGDLLVCLSCCSVLQLQHDSGISVVPETQMSIPMIHQIRRLQRTVQEANS